jgi:radical SAM superfamily enzyme YgiQ (UPF0313 family)
MYKDWHVRAADTVVQQIKYLSKKYDVDCVIDAADDFPANNEWAEKFFKHKARVIPDVIMRIYSRSSNINENVAKLMYHAGVRQVLLGIESGSEKMLKNCKKGLICNDHIKALNIFGDKGIKVDMSFVIGIEGETIETLSETINFVKNFRNFDLGTTFFNLFTPLPGSPSFTKIINNKKVKNKYSNDILPIKDLQNDWLSLFTDINRKDYMDAVSEVKNILKNVYSDYEINESKKS